jgi:SAM-dependent methyltransferase
METDYAAAYAELYRGHWWWRAREHLLIETLKSLVPVEGWNRVLDVGCGDGLFLQVLSQFGAHVEGLELDPSVVSEAAASEHTIHIQPLDESFRPQHSYDLICLLDVLEHLEDPAAALRRCHELLTPFGNLLVTVPAFRSLWTSHDKINHHYTRYRSRTLSLLVERAEFRILDSRYFFHWLFPVKLAIRAVEMIRRRPASPHIPPAILNRVLYAISRSEQFVTGELRLRFGSSLLLAAVRD